jgi:error-prone DNA polymerase
MARSARRPGPLLESLESSKERKETCAPLDVQSAATPPSSATEGSPLLPMSIEERLIADYRGTGMTVGPHPMAYHRAEMKRQGIHTARQLRALPDGSQVRVAGSVIARQRPGTAKGFVFLSLEDETGIANIIITPQFFEQHHLIIVHQQFLLVEGELQHQDGVISVKTKSIGPLSVTRAETPSHDFH